MKRINPRALIREEIKRQKRIKLIESKVDKHFDSQKKVDYSELSRLIYEALDILEGTAPPEEMQAVLKQVEDMLKKHFKDNKTEPNLKSSNKNTTTFENTGNAVARNKFMQALKKWADTQDGIEFELTVPYTTPDLGFIGGTFTVGEMKHKVVLKKGSGGSGGNVATQFEGNIIVGIYNVTGREAEAAKLKTALMSSGDIVDDEAYQAKANEVAAALVKKGSARGFKFGAVGSSSGGKVTASLTKTYTSHGVKSREAKADVSISNVGVSVKKLEESQFVAAQGPELAAIFDVAMRANRDLSSEMNQNVEQFIDRLQRAVGSADKAHAKDKETPMVKDKKTGEMVPNMQKGQADWYGTRDKFAGTKSDGKVDNTPYQKLLNKFLDLEKGGFEKVSGEEKEQLAAATAGFQQEGEKDFVELRDNVGDILTSQEFKTEVVREAVTGNGKFNEEEPRAKAILKWSMNDPSKSDFVVFTDDWFVKAASRAKLEIRDRGNKRGGSMRGEFDKVDEEYDILSDPEFEFTPEELKEINLNSEILYERFISDAAMVDTLLTEVDWAGMAGKAMATVQKGASWVKDKLKGLVKAFASAVAKIGAWVKKVLTKGFSYLVDFLGFEPVSVEVEI